jgi:hypothetical protein
MNTAELVKKPNGSELAPATPMDLLSVALNNNAAIDVIERLAALQEKALAREAEYQFNEAMSRVQKELLMVAPDLQNPQTHSKYASYAAIDKVVRPVYTREGLSLSFDTGDSPTPDCVRVVCYVSRGSHTRTYKVDMPADGKGAKGGDVMTKTHATGAAMSYGMRYLLKYIFNIAIGEDADGNSPKMEDLAEQLEWIANASDEAELRRLFAAAYKKAGALKDQQALKAVIAAKDNRLKDLR